MKLNTAIICLSPYSGGMELDSIKLAKKLSSHTNITIIAKSNCFIANQKKTYLNVNEIKLETIKFSSNLSFSIIKNVRKIVKKYNIKNVIFFGASELKSLYFAFLGLEINLIIRHGTTKSRPKKDWFHKLIYSNVNYHVSICKHLQNNVDYIIPFGKNSQAKLIYSSFDFKEPKHLKQKTLTLLHVGRVAKGKGQIDAIKACEILVENNIDFTFNIVGGMEKSYEKEFMTYYEQCYYKDKISLLGFTNNVNRYIQQADIFIFPSYGEGLSNSFLEALSHNLVCLSYDNTSFPELQELDLYFHIVENKNITQLKKKLLTIIQNSSIEQEKSKKNYDLTKTLFSLENEMNNYLRILK